MSFPHKLESLQIIFYHVFPFSNIPSDSVSFNIIEGMLFYQAKTWSDKILERFELLAELTGCDILDMANIVNSIIGIYSILNISLEWRSVTYADTCISAELWGD
jgi:hypothetical protein